MKKKLIPLLVLVPTLVFASCSQNTSINANQAAQILDMIIYDRYTNGDLRTFDEVSFYYSTIEGDKENIVCFYEVSKINNIIHIYNEAEEIAESWYYVDSNILYCSIKGEDGKIFTSIVEGDEDKALSTFNVYYYAVASDKAEKKINEIDRPANTKQRLEDLKSVNEENIAQKYRTKKNFHVSGDVKIYSDRNHKNFLSSFAFEYKDKYLISLSYREENFNTTHKYQISYEVTLTKDSIK
ncbi:MAG: hypothetical protein IJQ67_03910 [Bacilli bacterium]|nr:hypothetical protein [Bacilli bacterium]